MKRAPPRKLALRAVPDRPRWVEARGMLVSGRGELIEAGARGFLIWGREYRLLSAVGQPDPGVLATVAARAPEGVAVLAPPERAEDVIAALPEFRARRAVIHVLKAAPRGRPGKAAVPAVRLITDADRPQLERLSERRRLDLAAARRRGPLAAAFADGRPVSFCSVAHETETLWDLSIDTLPAYREQGHGAVAASFLIEHMREQGKQPVWGALESNLASLALAARLGFRPVDELWLLTRRERGR